MWISSSGCPVSSSEQLLKLMKDHGVLKQEEWISGSDTLILSMIGFILLKGEYDLHITDYCNLHCKGCVVLDYQNIGSQTM